MMDLEYNLICDFIKLQNKLRLSQQKMADEVLLTNMSSFSKLLDRYQSEMFDFFAFDIYVKTSSS